MSHVATSGEGVRLTRRFPLVAARTLRDEWRLAIPAAMLTLVVAMAVVGPVLAPHDPNAINVDARLQAPSSEFPLGTDSFGRDQLSRIIAGARISLAVAFGVAAAALVIGFPLGLLTGYLRGAIDHVVGRILDIVLSFPSLLLALALAAVIRPGLKTVFIALTVVYVPIVTRFVRGAVIAERDREYILASRVAGASTWRVITHHLVPNIASPLLVLGSSVMAFTVLSEAALSYLGFGTQPPTSSWGKMLAENAPYLSTASYLVIFPGAAISFLVLSLNLLGDALRDRLDPRQRSTVEEAIHGA